MLSFSDIYAEHATAVFRLAFVLSGDRHEAEDLTSEAFARALAGAERIRQPTVRSYLYAVVRNLVASRKRRPMLELAVEGEGFDAATQAAAGSDPGPEQRAELRQRIAHASAALDALPEGERQVVLLCGVHGLSNPEIADALGLSPGNVRVRLHRARRQLADILQRRNSP